MYDAIIVGARCAGSATALLLALQGHKVLLVDRATFPSDTISGHCVLHRGTVRLQRWGLLDKIVASNCPSITTILSNFGDFTLRGQVPLIENAPAAIAPRRTVLDTILAEAAVEAGAELRQSFVVTELLTGGDQVLGIRGQTQAGTTVTERARIVIGADGKHSKIAQLVQAPMYMEVPSLTCWYMTYWSDFPCDSLEIHWRPHHAIMVLPTNDGLTLVAAAWTHAEFHDVRRDIEKHYFANAALMPEVADRLNSAKRAEKYCGMADVPSFFRKPYGQGWALVGDAGHHKDPLPAYGISDAFCDAELLADAIHQGLSGEQSLEAALAQYEQKRNQRAIPDHELTVQRAHLQGWDAPEMLQLRAALRGNADDTAQYFGMIAKAIPAEQFLAPENLQRIMQQANLSAVPQ
jgi:2-polyprenyl-6-methoxyphenol hydroxylase-like FAD-dependent oxidoreductase